MKNYLLLAALSCALFLPSLLHAQHITVDSEVGCSLDNPPDPNPDDSTSCIRVCSGAEVVFDANSSVGQSNITWSNVGGNVISTNGSTVTVTWSSAGAGSISVEILTPNGIIRKTKCVEILPSPNAGFLVSPNTQVTSAMLSCINRNITFTDVSTPNGTSPIVARNWSFGDGTYSNAQNPNHTYTSAGTYTVTLEVVNACNCKSIFETELTVYSDEPIEIDCPAVACEGELVRYKGLGGCSSYDWTIIGGTFQTQASGVDYVDVVWDQVDSLGMGYISAANSGCGTCQTPTTLRIPVINDVGHIFGTDVICEGKSYLYKLPQWPATEYNWNVSGSGISIQPSDQPNEIIVTVDQSAGNQFATLRCAYDNNLVNCGGKAIIDIEVLESTSTIGPSLVCLDGISSYSLTGGHTGSWSLLNNQGNTVHTGSGSSYSPVFPHAGNYLIYVKGEFFCSPDPLPVEVLPKPDKPIELDGPTSVCPNIPYTFTASSILTSTTLNWEVVGGTFSNGLTTTSGPHVSVRFSTNGPYELRVWRQHRNGLGCTSDTLIESISKENVIPDIQGAPTTCDNNYAEYNSAYLNGELYEWKIIPDVRGTITTGNGTQAVEVLWNSVSTPQSANLAVAIRKCGVTYHDTLRVTILPTSDIGISMPDSVCDGEQFSLTLALNGNTVINSFSSIDWNFGDGGSANTTTSSINHTYTDGTSSTLRRTVTITVHNPNGCNKSVVAQQAIFVNPKPAARAFMDDYDVCVSAPEDTIYADVQSGVGAAVSFQWYHNNMAISSATTPKLVPIDFSLYSGDYFCVVTGSNGCPDTTNVIVIDTVPCGPDSTEGYPDNCEACRMEHNHLSLSSSYSTCGVTSVQATFNTTLITSEENWMAIPSNGVGITKTGLGTADFTFQNVGRYTLVYQVCHFVDQALYPNEVADTCYSSDTIRVFVPYIADIKYDVQCGSNGLYTVNFYDHSVRHPNGIISNYEFRINNSSVQNGASSTYTTNLAPGNHDVELRISGMGYESCVELNLNLPALPIADFSFDFDGACQEYPISFTNLSTPSANLFYEWDFDDLAFSNVSNPRRSYIQSGTYDVRLIVSNSLGCGDTITKSVSVSQNNLEVSMGVIPSSIVCDGNVIVLSAGLSGFGVPDQYIFQPNDFALVTHPNNTTSVFESGSYFVIARDANECYATSNSSTVEFVPTPAASIEGEDEYCLDDSIKLYGELGVGNYTYAWTQNGNYLSGDPNISIQAVAAGTHTFILTVSRAGSPLCSSSDTLEVTVHDPPVKPTLSFILISCQPYEMEITATSADPGTYSWSDGQTGAVIRVTEGGNFTATLTSAAGCTSEERIYIPKSPEEYIWIYPTGCYLLCEEQAPGEEYDLPDPIISFDYWGLNDPTHPVSWNATGTSSIPDVFLQANFTGSYSFTLDNGFCDFNAGIFDLTLGNECPCDIEIQYVSNRQSTSAQGCQNLIDFRIYNPYAVTITISFNSANGVFVPNTFSVPPGTHLFTLQFIPNPGFNGTVDMYQATANIPESPEEFIYCYKQEDYALPVPLCNDTSWYKMAGGVMPDSTFIKGVWAPYLMQMEVRPNPANHHVNIRFDIANVLEGESAVVTIFTLSGEVLHQEITGATEDEVIIESSSWKPGVYIVSVVVDEMVLGFRRLVVAR